MVIMNVINFIVFKIMFTIYNNVDDRYPEVIGHESVNACNKKPSYRGLQRSSRVKADYFELNGCIE